VEVVTCQSQIGSGSLPVDLLASFALCLRPKNHTDQALRALATSLRTLPQPVIGRVQNGALLLDLRALTEEASFLNQLGALDHDKD